MTFKGIISNGTFKAKTAIVAIVLLWLIVCLEWATIRIDVAAKQID